MIVLGTTSKWMVYIKKKNNFTKKQKGEII